MSRKRSSDGDSGSSKRFKNDQPSRVVFLRNLPGMVTDAEINEVCARFGTLVNIMRLDAKNQAFIEFEHLDGAKALLRTFNGQFPIKGKIASALYSDRQYISFTRELDDNPPNRILFVIITLQIHPVDCDTLYQVFSRIGKVRKVVLQTKAVQLQGFVEMETAAQAAEAKAQFNHKHIYACSCRLSIAFAKLQTLDCSDPNYTRDYTVSEPRSSQPASSSMAITSVPQDDQFSDRRSEDSGGCVLLVNGLDDKIKPEELFNLFGTCGDVMKVKILFNKRDSALLEFRNSSQAATAREMMQGCPISGRQLHIVPSSKDSINISRADNQEADLSRDFTHCGSHRFRDENSPQFQYIRPPCEILHVSNIPPNIDEEALMDAFAPFGARHAELFKKKTTMGTVVFKSVESPRGECGLGRRPPSNPLPSRLPRFHRTFTLRFPI
uniref:Polypyrimidine tract-binding protein 1/2 n=1 Tax=Euglena gracilis TaxID=3039 RepID=A0AA51UAM7_EUGGR|nr:polypyrimidine tract-binding protein 1/2 [Euglena gracilis]BDX17178.1 polypyrimidine tract-binding protein C [Euglena gracilis]